jgi:hypothetical protein
MHRERRGRGRERRWGKVGPGASRKEGSYRVPVTAQDATLVEALILDWCGSLGSASATVRIDTTKPQTEALNDVNVRRMGLARLHFRVTEPSGLSPSAKVVIKTRRSTGRPVTTITFDSLETNVEHIHPFKLTFASGLYRWCVWPPTWPATYRTRWPSLSSG